MNGEEVEGLFRRLQEKEQPWVSICVKFPAQAVKQYRRTVYTVLQARWYWHREQFKDISRFFQSRNPKPGEMGRLWSKSGW